MRTGRPPLAEFETAEMKSHYAICPLCEATCGLQVTTENHHIVGIRGQDDDPFSQGYLCPKGFALKALEEDPDRLTTPMLRRGAQWQAISWDEAWSEIADYLPKIISQHGKDAVAIYLGNPNVHNLSGQLYASALARVLGSRNVYSASSLDQLPKQLSCGLMFGDPMSIPIPDLNFTQYLLIIGANPLVSNGSLMTAPNVRQRLKKIRERGGTIVVIDPCRTRTAQEASQHHFIRPGRDAYFLMGLLCTLFEEDLVNLGHLAEHVVGLEEVGALAKSFQVDELAERCGIAADIIRGIARELAAAPCAAVYGRLGTCTQQFGSLNSYLIDLLNCLTGHLDRVGGVLFPKAAAGAKNTAGVSSRARGFGLGKLSSRVNGLPQVNGEMPTAALADEILTPGDGQIRALITVAGNPASSAPDSDRLNRALESLEFLVCVDGYLNETTRHANVILPGPGHLQRPHYDIVFAQFAIHNYARYSEAVFPLQPGQLDEWEILLGLAAIASGAKLNHQQMDEILVQQLLTRELQMPGSTIAGRNQDEILAMLPKRGGPERMLDFLLRVGPYGDAFGTNAEGLNLECVKASPRGIDLGPLQPRIPEVLRTPSGKIELAPAVLVADAERLRPNERDSGMVLIGRRELRSNNSWMHNLPPLTKGPSPCTLLINVTDAQRLELQKGDIAQVAALHDPETQLDIEVEPTDDIMAGVVSIPHGWGHRGQGMRMGVAQQRPGVNVNRLLSSQLLDPLSGNAVQNGVPVRVSKLQR